MMFLEFVGTRIIFVRAHVIIMEVANLYRNRWQIETFFKWIKQNLSIKALWGHSENAVKTHLWVAICTYLLVARIKASYKCQFSISEVATILSIFALERVNIRELLDKSTEVLLNRNQNVNEVTLF